MTLRALSDRAVARHVAERVIAESIADLPIGATCEHFGCETSPGTGDPRVAVCRVGDVAFCAGHAPRDSRYGLARMLLAALSAPTIAPG